jgi:hypothetical protein
MVKKIINLEKSYIFNTAISLVILILSGLVSTKLNDTVGIRWWIGTVFFICLYFCSLYEIPIKEGIKSGSTQVQILKEIVIFWIMPLILGVGMSFLI